MEPTPQQIQKAQGTRLSEKAPWETYGEEFKTKLAPEVEEAMKRYEERRHTKASAEAEEELARQKELNWALAGNYRWVKPEDYEKIGPRIGKIIHSQVFLNMLQKECGLKVWYAKHVMTGRLKLIIDKGMGTQEPTFVVWVQEGFIPEYSIMRFDEHGAPLDERLRGWRTVLLQMILKKVVAEETVTRVFGRATGPASEKYNSLLYEVRNMRVKAKEE